MCVDRYFNAFFFFLQQQNDHLQEMLRLCQNVLFGRKSEARVDAINPNQLQMFTPSEPAKPITPEEKVPVKGHTRKKRGRKPLLEDLPRVDVVHDIPEAEKQCTCGSTLSRIGEDVSEQLDYILAKLPLLRIIRSKYVCKFCEGVEDEGPTVKIAPVPLQLILQSIASERLVAHITISKFADAPHPQVPPKSMFGKAIQYTVNQWDRLVVYLEAGFLKPDNNIAENVPSAHLSRRKNWLFVGATKVAHVSATMFCLIETTKAKGIEHPNTCDTYLRNSLLRIRFMSSKRYYQKTRKETWLKLMISMLFTERLRLSHLY